MTGDESDRRTDRIEILGDLLGEVMVFQPMSITEISRAGAQVETTFPLQVDSLHDFRLVLGSRSVVVKGRIAHTHPCDLEGGRTIYRAGIEFIEPSERIKDAIGDFMEAILAGREARLKQSARAEG